MGIHEAVKFGTTASVRQLLRDGADVDERAVLKETPLHVAAKNGLYPAAALLIEHGADVNAKDYKGFTPLHNAAGAAADKVVGLLLKHGAKPRALNTYRETPLHKCAAGAGDKKDAAARARIAEKLIDAGAPVNAATTSGRTPLWYAAAKGNLALVRTLLARGADPKKKARGEQGRPVDAARMYEHDKVVALLEEPAK
jgi:ankyrin repeat protein